MPDREAYVRVSVTRGEVEAVAGLEFRQGDNVEKLYEALDIAIRYALWHTVLNIDTLDKVDDMLIAYACERQLRGAWPDRAYFLEVCRGPGDRWVQVFQPFGLPRGT
jgi:hypothetical protein